LPAGFRPDAHSKGHLSELVSPETLGDGMHVLHGSPEHGGFLLAEKDGPEIRCWHCTGNPDGSVDCVRIPCPWKIPPIPAKNVSAG
jgi:hypothetical protein